EDRLLGDLGAEREAELDRPLDRSAVRDRQRARVREADRARVGVRLRAEARLAAAEHLRPRPQVDVDLEADDGFPAHRSRSGTKSNASAFSNACPARNSVFSASCGPISWSPT